MQYKTRKKLVDTIQQDKTIIGSWMDFAKTNGDDAATDKQLNYLVFLMADSYCKSFFGMCGRGGFISPAQRKKMTFAAKVALIKTRMTMFSADFFTKKNISKQIGDFKHLQSGYCSQRDIH